MTVDAVSVAAASVSALTAPTPTTETEETADIVVEPPVDESTPVEAEESAEEKASGVLRLLQKGHFKGAASVRLRMNFMEEIQELEAEKLKEIAEEGLEFLNEAVETESAALQESDLLTEDQAAALEEFAATIEGQQAELAETENPPGDALIETLQNELDSLIGILTPAPETPQQPVETEEPPAVDTGIIVQQAEPAAITQETLPTEPATEEPVDTSDTLLALVQNFQESIQSLIDNLQSDLAESSVLPELSEPSGNGKAYAKFLAIYEDMLTPKTETGVEESLDIEEPAESE